MRVFKPSARTQIIAPQQGLELLDLAGGRTWRPSKAGPWENRECEAPDRVLVLGSSILYGSGYEYPETWTAQVDLPGTCIHNFAVPAYGLPHKLARLEEELALDPRLVVWEVWANDANDFVWVGDRGYSLVPGTPLDPLGVPDAFGIPPYLNGLLFHSRAYEALALSSVKPRHVRHSFATGLDRVLAHVGDRDLLLVLPPVLDKPFAESVEHPTDFGRQARRWAEGRDVRVVDLAELLIDEDVEALRLDPCCHYSAAGHAVIAERLGPLLAQSQSE